MNVMHTSNRASDVSGGSEAAIPDNLVAYWSFEESSGTVYDQVGVHHSNDVGSGVGYSSTGVLGNCLSFDNTSNAYIIVTETEDLDIETSDMTFSGWFNRTGTSPSNLFGGETGSFALCVTGTSFFIGNTGV